MKSIPLRQLIFWALCCVLGLFCKRLISPAANIVTDSLHIPGGVASAFSTMFLAVAAVLVPHRRCCTIMAAVQGMLALSLGMVGSMGVLMPIGYLIPGIVMDAVFFFGGKLRLSFADRIVTANALGSVFAALIANLIVFKLWGVILLLYLCVAATSGIIFGFLGVQLVKKLHPIINGFAKGRTRCL